MKWIAIVGVLSAAGLAVARDLNCWPDSDALYLFGSSPNAKQHELFMFSSHHKIDGHRGLIKTNDTRQEFVFYQCSVASSKYKNGGQIRSKTNPSMCVTPGAVHREVNGELEQYPADVDDRISLQPCATDHNLLLRKQWFTKNASPKSCIFQVTHHGWSTDAPSDVIVMSENGVALGSDVNPGTVQSMFLGPKKG
ncbi:hypothetical protein MVES1_003275, partial [Malassezia vespertilionis]